MSSLKNNNFWKNKSVLITGASGFVGSHLVNKLLQKKISVVSISQSKKINSASNIFHQKASVEDFNKINSIIKKNKVNIIFHLAAQPIVEIGQANPLSTFEVNVRGTWNMLEAARVNNIQKIIVASTTHVYGDNPNVPFKENYFPQPSRPYETSKACADLLAQSFADTFNLPVEIPRFVNIYGPGDLNFGRLIPKVIKSVIKGENPLVWDMGSIRDFLYIDDAIDAYLKLAEKDLPNKKRVRVFNIGSGKPIDIINLVKKIVTIAREDFTHLKIDYTSAGERSREIAKQYVSIAKAKKELGWLPVTSLDIGLKKTYLWYKKNSHLLK